MTLQILRPADVAEILNVSRVTVWRMEKRGELPPRKKYGNRCVGWDSRTFEKWMESRPYADPEAEEKRTETELETA